MDFKLNDPFTFRDIALPPRPDDEDIAREIARALLRLKPLESLTVERGNSDSQKRWTVTWTTPT